MSDDLRQDEPMCSSCGFPLKEYTAGLRHFGTHTAHVEWYCAQRLKGAADHLRQRIAADRAAMQQALEALKRGRPQIFGILVQQDQDNAIAELRERLK